MAPISLNPTKGSVYKTLSKNLKNVITTPEDFLKTQKSTSNKLRKLIQQVYDFTTANDQVNKNNSQILPELVVDDLDPEQIWQLIELRNNVVWPQFLEGTSKTLALKDGELKIKYKSSPLIIDKNDYESEVESSDESDNYSDLKSDDELDDEDAEIIAKSSTQKIKKKEKTSVVDDKFFKLSEMEAFLKAEDEKEIHKQKKQRPKDDFDINMFGEDEEKDDEENICYKDFFNEEDDKMREDEFDDEDEDEGEGEDEDENEDGSEDEDEDENENEDENEDEEEDESEDQEQDEDMDESENDSEENSSNMKSMPMKSISNSDAEEAKDEEPKSSFECRQERLNQRIKDHEEDILGEKPWQLKGEINATNRPQNSLLEEFLEFEATTRPAPMMTEQTTLKLEDIIRQRIKDQVWDDVEFKVKPKGTAQEYRKQLVLDQEKSKESLAHIYEKEYQQEMEKLDPNASESKDEEEPKAHKEIKEMMTSLFIKLDALSNFHFTPKPVAPEPKILTNTPAVSMEEVAPIAVSSAKLLAPEEIRNRTKGDTLGANERTKTDKNRERRHKKNKQKAIHKALEEKNIQKQKMGIKLNKKEETASTTKELMKRRNVEKMSTSQDAGSMKSSKAFFSKLHETTLLPKKNAKAAPKSQKNSVSAKKLKL